MSRLRVKALIKRYISLFLLVAAGMFTPLLLFHYENKAYAQEENIPNEYILQALLLPDWFIAEAIFAYEQDGKYYLPLRELAEGFNFFTEVDAEAGFAQGYASSEENTFTVDGPRSEIIIKGERRSISEDAILKSSYLATDDMYLQLEVINDIWPVNLRIELSNLTIFAEAEEELSFMRDKARNDRREQMLTKRQLQKLEKKLLPRRENPYQYLGKPVIDYQGIYRFDTEEDDLVGTNIFTGVSQFGKVLAEFSANFRLLEGEIERPDNVRLKLSRRSVGEEYLLPGVRRFEGGDVTINQRDLISNTTTGRGLVFSNDNKDRNREFDRITIEGTGPPGWDIELYNNDEIVDFDVVPDDGLYFFEDVVLNFGNNDIKIIFFGPQGQVREEFRSYQAGGSMLRPGEFKYSAGALDSDREFILLDNEPRITPRGVVKTGQASYGLNRWLTIFGNYTEIPYADEDRNYFTLGGAFSTPIGLFEAEGYREVSGGEAANLNYITKVLGIRTNISTSIYNDFESDLSGFGDSQKTFETRVQLNRNVRVFSVPLGMRLNALRTERKSGPTSSDIDLTQTYSRSGIRLSHSTRTRLTDDIHERTTGGLTSTIREGNWQFRGGLNYTLYPTSQLSSGNGEVRYKTDNDFQAALNFSRNFVTSDYRLGAQAGYDFDTFLGTAEASYERGMGWDFVVRATTSINPYTEDGGYEFSSRSQRQAAPVRARVFLDENADGVMNEGEKPLEGVNLRIGGGKSKSKTDEDGYIITNAPSDKLVNVSVDVPSLEDPYYIPGYKGFSVVPIKGKMIDANFPIVETGSIEGTAFRRSNNRAVAGLTLDLIDAEGEAIMSAETGFDGFYVFEFVPPGTYSIRTGETHDVQVQENEALVSPQELYLYGFDLYINDDDFSAEEPSEPFGPFPPSAVEEPLVMDDLEPAAGEVIEEAQHAPDVEAADEASHQAAYDNKLIDARFSKNNDDLRFILEAKGGLDYEVLEQSNANEIHIFLKETDMETGKALSSSDENYDYEVHRREGGLELHLRAAEPIHLKYASVLDDSEGAKKRLLLAIE